MTYPVLPYAYPPVHPVYTPYLYNSTYSADLAARRAADAAYVSDATLAPARAMQAGYAAATQAARRYSDALQGAAATTFAARRFSDTLYAPGGVLDTQATADIMAANAAAANRAAAEAAAAAERARAEADAANAALLAASGVSPTPPPPPPAQPAPPIYGASGGSQLPPLSGPRNQHRIHEEIMHSAGKTDTAFMYRERPGSQYGFIPEQERSRRRSQ